MEGGLDMSNISFIKVQYVYVSYIFIVLSLFIFIFLSAPILCGRTSVPRPQSCIPNSGKSLWQHKNYTISNLPKSDFTLYLNLILGAHICTSFINLVKLEIYTYHVNLVKFIIEFYFIIVHVIFNLCFKAYFFSSLQPNPISVPCHNWNII